MPLATVLFPRQQSYARDNSFTPQISFLCPKKQFMPQATVSWPRQQSYAPDNIFLPQTAAVCPRQQFYAPDTSFIHQTTIYAPGSNYMPQTTQRTILYPRHQLYASLLSPPATILCPRQHVMPQAAALCPRQQFDAPDSSFMPLATSYPYRLISVSVF